MELLCKRIRLTEDKYILHVGEEKLLGNKSQRKMSIKSTAVCLSQSLSQQIKPELMRRQINY
jgi:hypothetical protein